MFRSLIERRWYLRAAGARSQQVALVRLLTLAVERQLALDPMLRAFAQDTRGRQGDRVLRLAELLQSGVSLPDALEQVPGILPDHVLLTIRVGAQSGTLAASLRASAMALARTQDEAVRWFRGFIVYLCVLLAVLGLMVSFVMIRIVPTFTAIFQDHGIQLPRITIALVEISALVAGYWYLVFLAVLLAAWALLTGAVQRSARRACWRGCGAR